MCFESPSVSTSVGGIPEVVTDGEHGVLVPAGDVAGLARGVESLLANPAKRREMGRAAQRRAREQFSADVIVPKYEELYRRILA
jgi:glycosyltransferase involved in cell wall biosynthesis